MRRFGRRSADRELVRIQQRGFDGLASDYAAEIMRCRRAMRRAVIQIQGGSPDFAEQTLCEALAERWWR